MPEHERLPDEIPVVRCGQPPFQDGGLLHESCKMNRGYFGFSVQCGPSGTIENLAIWCRNNKIGTTTVGAIRSAGYDVVVTPGKGHHATVVVRPDWNRRDALTLALLFEERTNPVPEAERLPQ